MTFCVSHSEVNDDSIPHVLTLLHPKLTEQVQLAHKIQVIEALKVSIIETILPGVKGGEF